jgi:hypothetical protein
MTVFVRRHSGKACHQIACVAYAIVCISASPSQESE